MESPSRELRQLGFKELYPSNLRELLGCKRCGNILQDPVTTACGASYCHSCIAPAGLDSNSTKSSCPVDGCREYSEDDCPIDRTLNAVLPLLVGLFNSQQPDTANILSIVQQILNPTDHFECSICQNRFFSPVTLRCGHTFCLDCTRRCVDSHDACAYCRDPFPWPFLGTMDHHDPLKGWSYNLILASIITTCWRSELSDLQISYNQANRLVPLEMDIPLFVTTTSHPGQVTQLKIFEPRYRLFLRRIMETPSRTFGMVIQKPVNFWQGPGIYGTMLRIEKLWYPGERQIRIKTLGLSRFKVKAAMLWNGYWTAKVEPVAEEQIPDELIDWDYAQTRLNEVNRIFIVRDQNISLQWIYSFTNGWSGFRRMRFPAVLTNRQIVLLLREYFRLRFSQDSETRRDWIRNHWGEPPESPQEFVWYLANIARVLRWWKAGDEILRTTDLRSRLNKVFILVMGHIPRSITQDWSTRTH
jgi:hypothetical protein